MKPAATVTSSCIGRDVKFGGEFGNQMFQIAAVLGYAERYGCSPVFHPWKCGFSGRDYGTLFPSLDYRADIVIDHVLEQTTFRHNNFPFKPNCDLRGTLQSEKYFPRDPSVLRRIFAAPPVIGAQVDRLVAQHRLARFSAVHLRYYDRPERDDTPVMHTLPEHYYLNAIRHLDLSLPLLLVTNNTAKASLFARRHLPETSCIIQSSADPLVDFYLLARADHLAISNSTFGWWSGYLNDTAACVYAPTRKKWFSFQARTTPYWDARDIYCSRFSELHF